MSKLLRSGMLLSMALLPVSLEGCQWTTFDDLKSDAPVRVYEAPEEYRRSGYGTLVTAFNGEISKSPASRIIVSAGADSPVVSERIWDRDGFSSGQTIVCKKKDQCDKGVNVGATLIPFPVWNQTESTRYEACVFAPADPAGYVFCETNPGAYPYVGLGIDKPDKSALVFSGASLPEDHPLGYVLVGAYAKDERSEKPLGGGLYRLPFFKGKSQPLAEIEVIDPRTGEPFGDDETGDFGARVATAVNGKGELVIAIAEPSQNRVIVVTADKDVTPATLDTKLHTRACVKTPNPDFKGFGSVLTLGDVDGDDEPELFIGIDPADNKALQRLYAYTGASMPDVSAAEGGVCPLWDDEPVNIGCYEGVRGVACAKTAFGTSIAIGDVNGDTFGDLLVGAPDADVQGVAQAGVVWVFPGSKKGLVIDEMTNLYASGQTDKARLGASVSAVHTKGRDEPVAGAPGEDAVYMFTCSPLEETGSTFCVPK